MNHVFLDRGASDSNDKYSCRGDGSLAHRGGDGADVKTTVRRLEIQDRHFAEPSERQPR
jgi:hypothetical protein